MKNSNERFISALDRNINETTRALLYLKILSKLEEAGTWHSLDFIRLSYDAIYNDYISCCIRIFEDSEVSSFWYFKRCREKEFNEYCLRSGCKLPDFEKIRDSLKIVRNKTHFHIDKSYVKMAGKAWVDADIKGIELAQTLNSVHGFIEELYQIEYGKEYKFPEYEGEDAKLAAKYVEQLRK